MEQRDNDQNWSRTGAGGKEIARAAIYTRVSTSDQNPDLPHREIHDYATRQGWEIVETYQDTISGAKASRPGLNQLMADAMAKEILLPARVESFGRSLVDCPTTSGSWRSTASGFVAVTQALDTDIQNPASRFLLHVLGAAAEFERSLIRERTQAGRLRYQQDYKAGKVGKTVYSRSGKNLPIGRPKRIFNRERVLEMRRKGASLRAIAKQLGVGVGTVTRTFADAPDTSVLNERLDPHPQMS
jgi:DNA invertase Pin-like site-specific DNA recombinase